MKQHDPIARLRQRAYRHTFEDGIADIVVGVYTLMIGVATQRRIFIVLAAVYLVIMQQAWRSLHRQVSGPRTGYAELAEEPPQKLLVGIMAAGIATMGVVAAATWSSGNLWNLTFWPNWAPVLAGAILAGGFLHTATRFGLWRCYAYTAAALGGSLFFWLFPFGSAINPSDRLTLFLFSLAGAIIATGIVVLVRFTRRTPAVAAGDANDR